MSVNTLLRTIISRDVLNLRRSLDSLKLLLKKQRSNEDLSRSSSLSTCLILL